MNFNQQTYDYLLSLIKARPTLKTVSGLVSGTSGDMTKAVYDTDNSGVVDNSEKLGGHSDSYFQPALGYTAENIANKGVANGYAPLDSSGLIPSANLPSFVDDVLEYANLAAFPVTGETGKIYIDKATGKQYRWSGSAYIAITNGFIGSTTDVPEGTNLYFTNARFDTRFGTKTTDDLAEGTNLYFTVARVLASALTGLSASSGTFTATDTILVAFNKCKYLIDNFAATVRSTTLTGLSSSSGTYTASDTLLTALGKLKYNLDNIATSVRTEVTIISDYTDGTAVTSAGTNTISKVATIAANTISVGDICEIEAWFEKNGVSAANDRIYINTSNSLSGATLLATINPANTDKFDPLRRRFIVKSSTSTKFFAVGSSVATDLGTSTAATASINIDWTQVQYILFCCQNNVTGDSNLCTNATIKRTR